MRLLPMPLVAALGIFVSTLPFAPTGSHVVAAEACSPADVAVASIPAPPMHRDQYEASLKAARLPDDADIVMLGDSHFEYWPAEDIAKAFPGLRVANLGVNRDRTANVLWRLEQAGLGDLSPRLVFVLVGTNNIGNSERPCGVVAGLRAIGDKVRLLWPQAKIAYVGLLPRGLQFSYRRSDIAAVNDGMRRFLREDEFYIDMSAIDCGIGQGRPSAWLRAYAFEPMSSWPGCENFRSDWLHLDRQGYRLFGEGLAAPTFSIFGSAPEALE